MSKSKEKTMVIDTAETDVNPFADPSKLWISQDSEQQLPVKKLITTIAVRKPSPQIFFRCHPDNNFHRDFPARLNWSGGHLAY